MAYSKMSDDVYISNIPSVTNENDRSIKEDKIVNAAKLLDLIAGNATGNIPIANGTMCTNLNAEKLGGNLASAFATSGHTHAAATTSSNGLMSNTDKTKLDTIATAAEVNQNAYSNILVGTTTIAADAKSDTLTLTAGSGITLTPDATNDKVTIAVTANGHTHTDATTSASGFMSAASLTKLNGIATAAEVNQNAFSNVVANGVTVAADLESDTLTLIGGSGITLTGDATNDAVTIAVTPNGHTHTDATTSASGFMSPASLTKLNGIASGAEVNQNAFSNIVVGSTTIASDVESDTLTLAAGTNIALTGDSTNDKVTIGVTGTVAAITAAACTGNAATATTLATARAINGVSFNGSAAIVVEPYIEQDAATNASKYLTFVDSSTAGYQRLNLDTALSYNPSTNLLATSITGNAATATTATSAANATTAGGLAVNSTGVNNVVNQIARTNASGYMMCGYINSTAPDTTTTATSYWVETGGDGYLRPKSLANIKSELGVSSAFDGGHSLNTNGYQKFANGLILQWGKRIPGDATPAYGRHYQITFPIAFPNEFFSGSATVGDSGRNRMSVMYNATTTGMVIGANDEGEGGQNNNIYWTAMGY
ncbi:hypothetical protein SPSIL_002610 [Sporomusa silvacetica DSM 10669]|uniref:Putative tail fiber protein gp53-like C-terminal domain-containing protein n=1 Tax=Sporomusa silvacetica DSM 10669 TaxID=1123289 RepID=A0ABZ3IER7_9FIRM|nr:hypothetical protein SPSIL_29770 [Sporomusa silvacetica DSM 10669]